MKEATRPRLFFFGDSFVQWEYPRINHWTERFSEEYQVFRLGCSGSSNEGIVGQIATLPSYLPGDRFVTVLTSPYRLPLWMYPTSEGKWDYSNHFNFKEETYRDLLSTFELRKKDIITGVNKIPLFSKIDNPVQTFNLLGCLYNLHFKYKPVFVTWSSELVKLSFLNNFITLIPEDSYTTVSQEENTEIVDHHPGIEGGKVWYNKIKYLLDNWEYKTYRPVLIGTSNNSALKNLLGNTI